MGRITSNIGLITGVPITETVDKLIALQARSRDLVVARGKTLGQQQVALTELSALLLAFQFTTNNLGKSDLYQSRSVTSSNPDLLLATGGNQPPLGTFQFTPIQTVQSQQLLSSGVVSSTTPLGEGSLSLRFGGFVDDDTSLDVLKAGAGLARGRFRITDRSGASAEIDLRYAKTLEDVLRAVNENGAVNVRLEARGDRFVVIDRTGQTVSNLRIQEVGAGATAASLGLAGIDVAGSEALGTDVVELFGSLGLDRLNDGAGVRFNSALPDLEISFRDGSAPLAIDFRRLAVTGTQATATTSAAAGVHAQITITADTAGAAFDGVSVVFQNDDSITAGSETVAYDSAAKTLTFKIDAGSTTANQAIAALNTDPIASALFTASLPSSGDGTGLIDVTDTGTTSGGAAVEPRAAGTEATLTDVLATLNAADPTRLRAEIGPGGDRLVLTDLTSAGGGTFSVTALNGSLAAADLGLTAAANGGTITTRRLLSGLGTTLLESLNGGRGLGALGTLNLTDRNGTSASVDLSSAETLQDVLDAVNAAGLGITAEINTGRNGILLRDTTGATASNLIVANGDATNSADKLGLAIDSAAGSVSSGSLKRRVVSETTRLSTLNGGSGVAKGTLRFFDTHGASAVLNLSSETIQTVGDVLIAINRLGLGIDARINDAGDGILLVDTAGGQSSLRVAEGSSTAAADLHLLGEATTVSIDGTPTQVINGATTFDIAITATDTLETLVNRMNDLAIGVSAGIFNDGSGINPARLTLLSQKAGKAGQLLIDASNFRLSFEETSRAQDALLLYGGTGGTGGILATSSSNTFRDIVPGITLTVQSASTTAVSVTVAPTDTSLVAGVQATVENYNKLRTKINAVTAFDPQTSRSALLAGDGNVLRVEAELSHLLSGRFFGAGSIQSLESLGISLRDDGTLDFDAEKLRTRFAENPAAVKEFFSKEESGFSAKLKKAIDQLAGEENSLLTNRLESLNRKVEESTERAEFLSARLEKQRELLLAQFFRMEAAIAKIQSNLTALSGIAPLAFPSGGSSSAA